MTENEKLTVCIDVDGVLARYDEWKGIEYFGDPFEEAVLFTHRLSKFVKIIIFSTRCNSEVNKKSGKSAEDLRNILKSWLEQHNFKFDEIYIGQGKPLASAYIDDRAVLCQPQRYSPKLEFRRAFINTLAMCGLKDKFLVGKKRNYFELQER